MTDNEIHIGSLIKKTLKEQGRTITWLARQVNCKPQNIHRIFKCQYINTALLMTISEKLNHDFFADYSKWLFENIK
ncbi:MAG: hypothetical protein LBV69_02505 [Bacteroidales bacterium]|jgi:plasmid maintenance system antidote protein VapI|nr:hypothetical protein [Bacteroidales bacterium]